MALGTAQSCAYCCFSKQKIGRSFTTLSCSDFYLVKEKKVVTLSRFRVTSRCVKCKILADEKKRIKNFSFSGDDQLKLRVLKIKIGDFMKPHHERF
jgi:ribosomal protein S27AE